MAGTVALIFGGLPVGKIGELLLDATLTETHSYKNQVSQFPVETGIDINDNIKLDPDTVSLTGVVSNSPVSVQFSDVTDIVRKRNGATEAKRISREGTATRVETAQDILLAISGRKINGEDQEPQLVTIVTGLRVYTNMAMTSLEITRTGTTGQSLPFTAQFLRIQVVDTETITIPKPQPAFKDKTSSKVEKGNQTPKESSEKTEENVSVVKEFFNCGASKVSGFFGGS